MKKFFVLIFMGVFLLTACGVTGTEGTDIEVHDPWARPAFQGMNTAVYFLMHNHSNAGDEILSATTDIAETAELHKSEMGDNDVMQMNLQASVPLPADAEIEFQPGGLHIMLTNISRDLNVGDSFTVTLHFKVHPELVMTILVLDDGSSDHSHMDMDASPTP